MPTAPQPADVYKTMDLALRVGDLLLSSGAGAADVSAQMDNVARACGLRRFTASVTFTELSMAYQASPEDPPVVQLREVRQRGIDFGDLTDIDHLVRTLVKGRITRDEAIARVNRIVSTRHPRPRWAVTLGLGIMGSGIALLLDGNWAVMAIAFVAACCIDVISRLLARRRLPTFYQQVAGGLFATLLAAVVAATPLSLSPSRVITASIVLLLAGVSFLGGIQDALTGFPLTAGARMLEAIIATAGAIGGVSGGLTLARLMGVGIGTLDPGSVRFGHLWALAVGGAVSAAAYAFACHAPWRALLPIAVIAATAMALFWLATRHHVGVAWASGIAALLVGLVAYPIGARFRVPALVIVTAGIVPFLPGLSIYRGLALLGGSTNTSRGLLAMATAATITIALSSGAILGEYIAQPLGREARRLEAKLAGPRLVGPFTTRRRRTRR